MLSDHPPNVIAIVRALWSPKRFDEKKLSLLVSGIRLCARVAKTTKDTWGWEFLYGGLVTSGFAETEEEAMRAAETCIMLALKKPKTNWRQAKTG